MTSQRSMLISSLVNTECILCSAKFVTLLTIVAWCTNMLHFYMVPHVCRMLACVITNCTLPQPRGVLPHPNDKSLNNIVKFGWVMVPFVVHSECTFSRACFVAENTEISMMLYMLGLNMFKYIMVIFRVIRAL